MKLYLIFLILIFLLMSIRVFYQFVTKSKKKSILVLGDSHTRVFQHINKKRLMPDIKFDCLTINGVTAQGICNPNSKTNANTDFKKKLSEKKHDEVMIMVGEVDCGFTMWYRKDKYNTSIKEQLDNAVSKLFEFIDNEIRTKYDAKQITVIGANLPTLFDHITPQQKVRREFNGHGTLKERTKLTLMYNDSLKNESIKRRYKYIDIVKETMNQATQVVDKQYLRPNERDHHLSEDKTALFWKNAIIRSSQFTVHT